MSSCGDTSTVDQLAAVDNPSTTEAETKSVSALAEPETSVQPETEPLSVSDEEMLDLTTLSASMVYGQVYDMVYNPDNYKGRMVRVKGPFAYYQDPATNKEYFAVLITDAMACCSQGIEFVLDGEHTYPDDYPAVDEETTVTGIFNFYKENGNSYCQLLNAKIE